MLNESTKNPELSFEQLQAIDVVQKRLSNLEAEIVIASKNLVIEKKEVVKATKEREYQEELLAKLKIEIPVLQVEKEKLVNLVAEGEKRLSEIAEADRILKVKQAEIAQKQTERENKIREEESDLLKKQEQIRKEKVELQAEKEKIEKFKESLSVVLKTW